MAPGSATIAYIGFRAPLVPATNRALALIVPVLNFTALAAGAGGGAPGSASFGPPIELNLGCRGVRSIEGSDTNYLIVAGPPGKATGVAPADFRLFTWSGLAAQAPQERAADLSGLLPEGIVELPPPPWSATNQFQLISDNGITLYYGDDIEAKHLPFPNFKKCRTDWVTLGAVVTSQPVIRTMTLSGTNLVLTWCAVSGQTYRVQSCTNLNVQMWNDLGGDVTATHAIARAIVPVAAIPQRFYRVIVP
jgi:hypothetical protein